MARQARVREVVTVVAVLCALLAGGGCTGGDGGDGRGGDPTSRPAAQPKKLKKAWEAPIAPDSGGGSSGSGTVWAGRGILAVRDGSDVRGYDARTGKKRWTLKRPKGTSGVCGMSDKPSEAGLGGLFFTTGKKNGCSYAGAVDLADGEVKWAKPVGRMKGSYAANDISIGDEALTVTLDCYGVKQFRPRDGKPLGTRLKSDKACAHEVDHNGRHLAVREAPVGGAREVMPGWIRADDGAQAHFALHEGADEKPVWRTKAARVGDELHGIVSDDPVVLDISREGHRLIQTYDADGKPVRPIGKQLKRFDSAGKAMRTGPYAQGDTVVMGYGRDPALYAYDLNTGKVRWKMRQDAAQVLGVWKDKLLALRQMKGRRGLPVPWLVTYGMRDGKERTVGRIGESGVQALLFKAWDGDRIYLSRTGEGGKGSVIAYPLPSSGGDTRRYAGEPMPQAGGTAVQKHGWRKGDLRPDAVANACEAVSPTAQRAMRVYRKGMPPPVDCAWVERDAPRHADRELEVTVTAHQPGGDEESGGGAAATASRRPTPAVEVAEKAFRETGKGKDEYGDNSDKLLADGHRLDGLGDEAKSTAYGSVRGSASSAHILVRYRNVTVRVAARTEALSSGLRGEVPPQHRVEAAARVAAADVLDRLGAEVPASARRLAQPAGGGIAEARSVCARLRSEAAGLVPGAKALDTTPKDGADGRVAGCEWDTEADASPRLTVQVKAAPDSPLTGDDAAERAKAELASADGTKLSGLGDEARLERDSFTFRRTGNMNRQHTLTIRQDNLLLLVDYQRWHHPSRSQLDADVRRVALRVLSAY